eukprot:1650605-Pleurochrysis_carterae.AAC.3
MAEATVVSSRSAAPSSMPVAGFPPPPSMCCDILFRACRAVLDESQAANYECTYLRLVTLDRRLASASRNELQQDARGYRVVRCDDACASFPPPVSTCFAGLANVGVAVTASYEAAIEATYSLACAKVKAAGVNIVFATVLQSDLVGLMQAAESASLWGEGYAWVLAQHMNTDALVASASAVSLSRQSVVSLLDGLLTFVDSPRHSEGFSSFSRAIANSSSLVCARIKAAIDGTEDSMSSHSVTAGAMVGSEMDGEIGEHSLRRVSESHRDGGLAGLSQMDSEMTNQSLLTGNMTGRNSLASEMGSSMNYDHSSHFGAPVALRKEAAYAYDCVAALAMALAHAPSPSDGNGVFDALLSGGFEGASGLVAFDLNTADRATSTVDHVLHNWVPSDSGDALLELYKDHFSLARGWAAAEPAIRWPGGVFTTPLDHTALPPCEINHIRDLTSGVPRCA